MGRYDYDDRLQTITAGSTSLTHTYDYSGQRVLKSPSVGNAVRYWEGLLEIEGGILRKHYFALGARVATREQGGTTSLLFYHPDHLGSPQVLTDGGGSVVQYIRYRPYGETRGIFDSAGNPVSARSRYLFTDQERDLETGLDYFGARFYDSEIALFLTHDPQAQYDSPYSYAGGNPVNLVDPDGELFGCGECEGTLLQNVVETAGNVLGAIGNFLSSLGCTSCPGGGGSGDDVVDPGLGGPIEEPPPEETGEGGIVQREPRGERRPVIRDAVIDAASTALIIGDILLGGPTGEGIGPAAALQSLKRTEKTLAAVERLKNILKGIPGKLLGPSGKPKIHRVKHSTLKRAKDAARQRAGKGGTTVKHSSPRRGEGHFHGVKRSGENVRIHDEYPK